MNPKEWLKITDEERAKYVRVDIVHYPKINNDETGAECKRRWLDCGLLSRQGAPALLISRHNGDIETATWYTDGHTHRLDGPADMSWHPNNQIQSEIYFIDGACTRLDGPAVIEYDQDGNVVHEECYVNDKRIRGMDGFRFGTPEWEFQWQLLGYTIRST